jgi:IclR family transcriptional regulator, acetate operon repressor
MSKTERAMLILERLTSGESPPTHAELMRELGVQRSTLSDSLGELRELGYVAARDRRYLPGARLLTFVRRAALHGDLAAGVRPTLEWLAKETGETAVYVIEDGGRPDMAGKVVAVDQVESRQPIRFVADIGVPFPIHATAAGQAFLAFTNRSSSAIPVGQARRLDAEALDAELPNVRERGFAMVRDTARATSVAAPVRDARDAPIGVISVVGPSDRLTAPESQIWPALERAIEQLTENHR